MKDAWTLFLCEFRAIIRNKGLRSMLLLVPLIYGILIPSIYLSKRVKEVAIGVVDQDHSKLSRQLLRMLDATEGAAIKGYYQDLPEAREALQKHEIHGLFYIPSDFEKRFKQRQGAAAAIGVASSNLMLAGPLLSSAASVAATLSGAFVVAQARAKGAQEEQALRLAEPLKLDLRPVYNPAFNYGDSAVPGILFTILQQIIIVALCFAMAEEKENRSPMRHSASFAQNLLVFFVRILPYAVINLGLSMVYLLALQPVFGIPVQYENLFAAFVLCFFFGLATSSFGFMLSHAFKDRMTVLICMMFYSLPGFLSSGYTWPFHLLTLDVRLFGYLFPISYFGEQIRKLCLGPFSYHGYQHVLITLVIYTAVCAALSLLFMRLQRRTAQ